MKKLVSFLIVMFIFVVCLTFSASAESFSYENISINVPEDLMLLDDELTAEYMSTKIWTTADLNFILDLTVKENDDKIACADYSESEFKRFFEGYISDTEFEENGTLLNAENISITSMDGIRLDIKYEDSEETFYHTLCVFNSETKSYLFYFDVYDEAYSSYVDDMLNSLVIEDTTYELESETNIVAIVRLITFVVIFPLISFIKKKRDKKKIAQKNLLSVSAEQSVSDNMSTEDNMQHDIKCDIVEAKRDNIDSYVLSELEKERKEREKMFD